MRGDAMPSASRFLEKSSAKTLKDWGSNRREVTLKFDKSNFSLLALSEPNSLEPKTYS